MIMGNASDADAWFACADMGVAVDGLLLVTVPVGFKPSLAGANGFDASCNG